MPSVGRIPSGATVEREVANAFDQGDSLVLNLHRPDFTTAHRLAEAINEHFGNDTATAIDAISVRTRAPTDPDQRVGFVSLLENLDVAPGQAPARVVVNARTGTIVMGGAVQVLPAAVAHGSLTVTVHEDLEVSQPEPFSHGDTVVVTHSTPEVEQTGSRMFPFGPGTTLDRSFAR